MRRVLDAFGQDFDRTCDHREHVVEVMGDAAGQLPDRFHLLRLDQLFFGETLLGNVPDKGVDDVTVTATQRRQRYLDEEFVAIPVPRPGFVTHADGAAGDFLEETLDPLPCAQRDPLPETPNRPL